MNAAAGRARWRTRGSTPTLGREPRRPFRTRLPCAAATWRRHRRRGSCWGPVHRSDPRATTSSVRCKTSTPPAFHPSRRTPVHRWARRPFPRARPPRPPRHDPAWRRCCSSPSGPRRRARRASRSGQRSGSSCAATRRYERPAVACWARTPCAGRASRAFRVRRDESPCGRTGRVRDRRRDSRAVPRKTGSLKVPPQDRRVVLGQVPAGNVLISPWGTRQSRPASRPESQPRRRRCSGRIRRGCTHVTVLLAPYVSTAMLGIGGPSTVLRFDDTGRHRGGADG